MTRPLIWLIGGWLLLLTLGMGIVRGESPPPQGLVYMEATANGAILHIDAQTYRLSFNTHGLRYIRPPVASPDGAWLAFALEGVVYTVRRDGTGLRRVAVLNDGSYYHIDGLAWSSDGGRILATLASPIFEKRPPPRQRPRAQQWPSDAVFIIEADGSGHHLVTPMPYIWFIPALWTPDHEWVIYSDYTGVHRIRSDGTDQQTLYPSDYFQPTGVMALSPDGQWLLFSDEGYKLVQMRPDGSAMTRHEQPVSDWLSWSPNGRWLGIGLNGALWLTDAVDKPPRLLLDNQDGRRNFSDMAWSPDGQWLLGSYYDYTSGENVQVQVAVPSGDLTIIDAGNRWLGWVPPVRSMDWHGGLLGVCGLGLLIGGLRWQRHTS